jgi:8-oxo-dGTP diphosphatase
MTDTIRAAGAVLWRPAADGIEICVVHRPGLDDWVLPKGKLESSEHSLVAAVREVLEETGVRGRPQLRLPEVAYELPDGTPKTVDYWLMRAADDPVRDVQDVTEVDAVTWLSPAQAMSRLSYPADAASVEHAAGLPPITAITPLVRHAHAGERKKWSGDDALRPLDRAGASEADGLGVVLALFEPARFFAATPLRCKQTLEPAAERLGLPIVLDSAFAEPADLDDLPAKLKAATGRLGELREGATAAICSQGKVIPPLLASLLGEDDPAPYKTPKGTGWLLSWSGDTLSALSRL